MSNYTVILNDDSIEINNEKKRKFVCIPLIKNKSDLLDFFETLAGDNNMDLLDKRIEGNE